MWGQSTLIISSLSPKRDWGPKRDNGDRAIKREVIILAEERSVAMGKFFMTTSDKRNLGELVAWGGTSISGCRAPAPYLSLLYQSTSSVLAINK